MRDEQTDVISDAKPGIPSLCAADIWGPDNSLKWGVPCSVDVEWHLMSPPGSPFPQR